MSSRRTPASSAPAVMKRGRSGLLRTPRSIAAPTAAAGIPAIITTIQATPGPNRPTNGPIAVGHGFGGVGEPAPAHRPVHPQCGVDQ